MSIFKTKAYHLDPNFTVLHYSTTDLTRSFSPRKKVSIVTPPWIGTGVAGTPTVIERFNSSL